jgi:septal ring factor EnvC (AmiA/AmiB activator)
VKRCWLFLLITFALIGQPVGADSKADLQSVRAQLQKLQQEYQRTRESSAEAADALKQSERAISEAGRRLHQLDSEQRETQAALKTVTEQTGQTDADIRQRQAHLSEMFRQAYMRGGGDALKLLLNGQNPSQAARDLHYLSYFSRAQMQLIDELRQDLARLTELKQSAAEKDRALSEIRQAQLKERQNLLKEKQARQKVLNQLAGQIKQQRKEITTLKRNEQRLSDLVARLAKLAAKSRRSTKSDSSADKTGATGRKIIAVNTQVPEPGREGTPFSRLKGLLRLPVRGELMNQFGTPREGGGLSWKGLFIRAPEGTEVRAVAEGTVAFADWLRGFGNLVIVDHGEGYMSLYSNNESLYKQAGDPVKMGEPIASVGNSGGQEGTGVYFELRHQSRPINPMAWIK